MFESLFNFLINMFFYVVRLIGGIFLYPIQLLIVSVFPTLGDFIAQTLGFFVEYIFPMVGFCKELFLEVTQCPRALFSIFVNFIFIRWAIAPAIRGIKLALNAWKLAHGGMTE